MSSVAATPRTLPPVPPSEPPPAKANPGERLPTPTGERPVVWQMPVLDRPPGTRAPSFTISIEELQPTLLPGVSKRTESRVYMEPRHEKNSRRVYAAEQQKDIVTPALPAIGENAPDRYHLRQRTQPSWTEFSEFTDPYVQHGNRRYYYWPLGHAAAGAFDAFRTAVADSGITRLPTSSTYYEPREIREPMVMVEMSGLDEPLLGAGHVQKEWAVPARALPQPVRDVLDAHRTLRDTLARVATPDQVPSSL